MKGILIWLIAAVTTTVVGLVIFGANPSDLLQIPVNVFNSIMGKTDASSNGAPETTPVAMPASLGGGMPPAGTVQPPSMAISETSNTGVELAALTRSPKEWPKFVTLKETTDFPSTYGNVKVPKGMQLKVVAVSGNQIQVEFQGNSKLIPSAATDLVERVLAARKK